MSAGPAQPRRPWWVDAFGDAVRCREAAVPLDRAAVLLAGPTGVPSDETDVERQLARLDALAAGCRPATFEGWHRHLFAELGFTGDTSDYHDPRNSFLPSVLDRRRGLPISLAVLGIEVGRRLGLAMWGVGMPGHFLLGHGPEVPRPGTPSPPGTVFVDCFHGGELLDVEGCRARHAAMFGDTQPFDERLLARTGAHMLLIRMLANLKSEYARRRDLEGLTSVLRLRAVLPGMSFDEARELVRTLDASGRWAEASEMLEQLERSHPLAGGTLSVERKRLRARMN